MPAAPASVSCSSIELYGWKFDTLVTGMAFVDHVFSPVLTAVGRPRTVHHALHEPVECFQLDAGSDNEGTAAQAAKRAKKEEGVALPNIYRITGSQRRVNRNDCSVVVWGSFLRVAAA